MMMGYGSGFGIFGLVVNFLLIVGVIYLVLKWVREMGTHDLLTILQEESWMNALQEVKSRRKNITG